MDYSTLTAPPVRTRNSSDRCHCFLCAKGRQTLVPQVPSINPKHPIKLCPSCQGKLSPGVSHVCTRVERNSNIVEIVKALSDRSKGQVLSETLKGKTLIVFVLIENKNLIFR